MKNRKDRDDKGRFLKGAASPSPGRPPRRVEESYLDATIGECTVEAWREIVAKAVADAREGNRYARDFLAKYLLPEQAIKLLIGQRDDDESAAKRVIEVVIPGPRIGPHGAQAIEGEVVTDDGS